MEKGERDMFKRFLMGGFIVIGLLAAAGYALALPIPGLFTTGVDNSNVVLPLGASDPHYIVIESANSAAKVISAGLPGTWVPNNSTSQWVWENASGLPVNVTRTFRTTFDLTGLDASTASISGTWATDNSGLDILINSNSTLNTSPGFGSYSSFAISSGFVSGLNTLDFVVQDVGGISGFRVGSLAGTASPIPEPTTMLLLGSGLIGLAGFRRRMATKGRS